MGKNASLLRELARKGQYGHSRTPRNYYMCESYCDYYWSRATSMMTYEQWKAVYRLSTRYHRMIGYVTEVLPEWEDGKKIYYADNSISMVQHGKDGQERTIQIKPPSGDLCY